MDTRGAAGCPGCRLGPRVDEIQRALHVADEIDHPHVHVEIEPEAIDRADHLNRPVITDGLLRVGESLGDRAFDDVLDQLLGDDIRGVLAEAILLPADARLVGP